MTCNIGKLISMESNILFTITVMFTITTFILILWTTRVLDYKKTVILIGIIDVIAIIIAVVGSHMTLSSINCG